MYVNSNTFKIITVLFCSLLAVYFSVWTSGKPLPLLHVAHEYKYFLSRSCEANLSSMLQRSLAVLPNLVAIVASILDAKIF